MHKLTERFLPIDYEPASDKPDAVLICSPTMERFDSRCISGPHHKLPSVLRMSLVDQSRSSPHAGQSQAQSAVVATGISSSSTGSIYSGSTTMHATDGKYNNVGTVYRNHVQSLKRGRAEEASMTTAPTVQNGEGGSSGGSIRSFSGGAMHAKSNRHYNALQLEAMESTVPKIIWMYWSQGKEDMLSSRLEHRMCYQSWRANNPTWSVRVVDLQSLAQHIGVARSEEVFAVESLQSQSDLARLYLLMLHGGVYVDVDVYSVVPLDSWLGNVLSPEGFFIFSLAGRDRLIASWFIASAKACADEMCTGLLATWAQATGTYLQYNNHKFEKYLQIHFIFTDVVAGKTDGVGVTGDVLSESWSNVPKVYATVSKDDPCCVPVLPPRIGPRSTAAVGRGAGGGATAADVGWPTTSTIPRVSVRALPGGFCAAMTTDAKQMLDSGRVPVIKGRAKRGPAGAACPGIHHADKDALPPAGSILEYLVARTANSRMRAS